MKRADKQQYVQQRLTMSHLLIFYEPRNLSRHKAVASSELDNQSPPRRNFLEIFDSYREIFDSYRKRFIEWREKYPWFNLTHVQKVACCRVGVVLPSGFRHYRATLQTGRYQHGLVKPFADFLDLQARV